MFENYERKIRGDAVAHYPKEAVWLITENRCWNVDNIHDDPENFFEVSAADLRVAYGEGLLAVVHSHTSGWDVPSAEDMRGQERTDVPWGVLLTDSESAGRIRWWGGTSEPLVGRPFVHGIHDCYALIRDYYKQERSVNLPIFPRDWEWWNKGEDLLMDGFEEAGFKEISAVDVEEGDVWFANFREKTAHHCGVYVGNGLMLHQIGSPGRPVDYSRLSAREPIGRYHPFICKWLRYVGQ